MNIFLYGELSYGVKFVHDSESFVSRPVLEVLFKRASYYSTWVQMSDEGWTPSKLTCNFVEIAIQRRCIGTPVRRIYISIMFCVSTFLLGFMYSHLHYSDL